MSDEDDAAEMTRKAEAISMAIRPLLAHQGMEIQGAVLADLVSIFFAGHHPAIREEMIADWIKTMRDLIPISEAEMFGDGPRPEGWGRQ